MLSAFVAQDFLLALNLAQDALSQDSFRHLAALILLQSVHRLSLDYDSYWRTVVEAFNLPESQLPEEIVLVG